jgi:hypothetical protein
MLKGSDLVWTMPLRVGASLAERFGSVAAAPPVELALVRPSMVFHRRYEQQSGHVWLRQTVQRLAR